MKCQKVSTNMIKGDKNDIGLNLCRSMNRVKYNFTIQYHVIIIMRMATYNPSHKLLRLMRKMVLFRLATSNVKLLLETIWSCSR